MTRRLVFRPAAKAEARAAIEWYQRQRDGLGAELFESLDRAISEILESPTENPTWAADPRVRKKLVARFPYVVFFTVSREVIRVVAVAHQKRAPGYWKRR